MSYRSASTLLNQLLTNPALEPAPEELRLALLALRPKLEPPVFYSQLQKVAYWARTNSHLELLLFCLRSFSPNGHNIEFSPDKEFIFALLNLAHFEAGRPVLERVLLSGCGLEPLAHQVFQAVVRGYGEEQAYPFLSSLFFKFSRIVAAPAYLLFLKLSLKYSKGQSGILLDYFIRHRGKLNSSLIQILKVVSYYRQHFTLEQIRTLAREILNQHASSCTQALSGYKPTDPAHLLAVLLWACKEIESQSIGCCPLVKNVLALHAGLAEPYCDGLIKSMYNKIQDLKRNSKAYSNDLLQANDLELQLIRISRGRWKREQTSIMNCHYFACKQLLLNGSDRLAPRLIVFRAAINQKQPEFAVMYADLVQTAVRTNLKSAVLLLEQVKPSFAVLSCRVALQGSVGCSDQPFFKLILQKLAASVQSQASIKEVAELMARALDKIEDPDLQGVELQWRLKSMIARRLEQVLLRKVKSLQPQGYSHFLGLFRIISDLYQGVVRQQKAVLVEHCLRFLDYFQTCCFELQRFQVSSLQSALLKMLAKSMGVEGSSPKATLVQLYSRLKLVPGKNQLEQLTIQAKLIDYLCLEQTGQFADAFQQTALTYAKACSLLGELCSLQPVQNLAQLTQSEYSQLARVTAVLDTYCWLLGREIPGLSLQRLVRQLFPTGPAESKALKLANDSRYEPGARIAVLKKTLATRITCLQKNNLVPDRSCFRPSLQLAGTLVTEAGLKDWGFIYQRSSYRNACQQVRLLLRLLTDHQQHSYLRHLLPSCKSSFLCSLDIASYLQCVICQLASGCRYQFSKQFDVIANLLGSLTNKKHDFTTQRKWLFGNRRSSICRQTSLSEVVSALTAKGLSEHAVGKQLLRVVCASWARSPINDGARTLQAFVEDSRLKGHYGMQLKSTQSSADKLQAQKELCQLIQQFWSYEQVNFTRQVARGLASIEERALNLAGRIVSSEHQASKASLLLSQKAFEHLSTQLARNPGVAQPRMSISQRSRFRIYFRSYQHHARVKKYIELNLSQDDFQGSSYQDDSAAEFKDPAHDTLLLVDTGSGLGAVRFDQAAKEYSWFPTVAGEQLQDFISQLKQILRKSTADLSDTVVPSFIWWKRRDTNQKSLRLTLKHLHSDIRLVLALAQSRVSPASPLMALLEDVLPKANARSQIRSTAKLILAYVLSSRLYAGSGLSGILKHQIKQITFFKCLTEEELRRVSDWVSNRQEEQFSCEGPLTLVLPPSLQGVCWQSLIDRPCYRAVVESHLGLPSKNLIVSNSFYQINPQNNLSDIVKSFEDYIPLKFPLWTGAVNEPLPEPQFQRLQEEKDLFIFMGHGHGKKVPRIPSLLLGCCSCQLYSEEGEMLRHIAKVLNNGVPFLLGCLWTVTSNDLDKMCKRLLQLKGQVGTLIPSAKKVMKHPLLNGGALVSIGCPAVFV